MGLNAQKKYGVDVVVEDVQGTLYAEVEGTTKSVQVDKSRKLLEDISRAEDPASVRGAIIGNPFGLQQPNDRPVGQRKLFVGEVEEAAKRFGWALITTGDPNLGSTSHLREEVTGYLFLSSFSSSCCLSIGEYLWC